MNKYSKYIGKVHYELTCTSHAELDGDSPANSKYTFTCVCGSTRTAVYAKVTSGLVKRCHLCAIEAKNKHKMWGTPIYNSWRAMKARCKHHSHYTDFGYPVKWLDFAGFMEDLGSTHFDGAVLDRIDNALGYSFENCQWLTRQEHGKKSWRDTHA